MRNIEYIEGLNSDTVIKTSLVNGRVFCVYTRLIYPKDAPLYCVYQWNNFNLVAKFRVKKIHDRK
jgi:hypothetical protein